MTSHLIFLNLLLVNEHFGQSKPEGEKDSYGTPIGQPVGPADPIAPSIDVQQPSIPEVNNPFTKPPYQTTFTETPPVCMQHNKTFHINL